MINDNVKYKKTVNNSDLYNPILNDSDLIVNTTENKEKKADNIRFNIKVCLIGNTLSGKSTYIDYLINKRFVLEQSPTIGVDYNVYKYTNKDKLYKFCIWDTSGIDSYYGITKSYFDSASIYLLFIDMSNHQSINSIKFWINEVNKFRKESKREEISKNPPFFVVLGSKYDKNVFESADNYIKKICHEYRTEFIKISIKDELNIDEPFQHIIKYVEKNKKKDIYGVTKLYESYQNIDLNKSEEEELPRKCCCTIL